MPDQDLLLALNQLRMRLPADAACIDCGETHPVALVLSRRPLRCYQCRCKLRGLSGFEEQHLGRRPSPVSTVTVPGNHHRLLSLLQDTYWVGEHEPGSMYAVGFDIGAWIGVTALWTR